MGIFGNNEHDVEFCKLKSLNKTQGCFIYTEKQGNYFEILFDLYALQRILTVYNFSHEFIVN